MEILPEICKPRDGASAREKADSARKLPSIKNTASARDLVYLLTYESDCGMMSRSPRDCPFAVSLRGVRVVYGAGLRNRCGRKSAVGSNPIPSAKGPVLS